MNKPVVSIARNKNIKQAVFDCLDKIEIPNLDGKKILLKPNVGREVNKNLGINTNPKVVEAIFEYLDKKFNANFFLGDSPIIMTNTHKAFKKSGFSSLMNHEKIQWLDLDSKPPKIVSIKEGKVLKKIRLSGFIDDFDYIISIPVLKMHMHTGATLSFKNMKGLIYKRDKIKLHHLESPEVVENIRKTIPTAKELDIAISDLSFVLKPDLAIVDATISMGGLGPSSGTIKKSNTIIASTDYLAADIISLYLAQPHWDLNEVPHLPLIAENKNKNHIKSISNICTKPENIEEFLINLEEPPKVISIKYPNVELYAKNSCSSCVSTIFLFLKNNQEFINEYYNEKNPLRLVIGTGNSKIGLYEDTFLVGNCTSILKDKGIFIKGCPPVQSVLLKNIKSLLEQKQIFKKGRIKRININ